MVLSLASIRFESLSIPMRSAEWMLLSQSRYKAFLLSAMCQRRLVQGSTPVRGAGDVRA